MKKCRLFNILIFGLLALCFPLRSFSGATDDLASAVDRVLDSYGDDRNSWGINIRSLATGEDLYSLNADNLFMPASNLKLIVTAAALDRLGPDFTYVTSVLATDSINPGNGVLAGDLILRGSGDPTISDRFYPNIDTFWKKLAEQVREAGIREIRGRLVADNSLFGKPNRAEGWLWDDVMWWYGAPVSALSYNDNCLDVEVFPAGDIGSLTRINVRPETASAKMVNRAYTVSSRLRSRIDISRDENGAILVEGGLYTGSPGYLEHVTVENPARLCLDAFATALAQEGIVIRGAQEIVESPERSRELMGESPLVVAQNESPPLKDIVGVTNKRSHNFYAEQLLFTLGSRGFAQGGFDSGLKMEEYFLKKAGVKMKEMRIMDGSGLSRLNLVKPREMVNMLEYMHSHQYRDIYLESLPVAGHDNGVRQMVHTTAQDRIFAKTGYIKYVMALSGYAMSADDEWLAFSIIGNNLLESNTRSRRLIRDICVELAKFRRRSERPRPIVDSGSGEEQNHVTED